MTEAVRLKTNEYWGRQSGSISKEGQPIFKGRRGAKRGSENKGPCGYKTKPARIRARLLAEAVRARKSTKVA